MSDDDAIRHSLAEALLRAGDTHDLYEHVCPMIYAGRAQYWQNDRAAVVTELIEYPKFKAVNYWLVGGELGAALALAPDIERWARHAGCKSAVATGRPGWRGYLEDRGWKVIGTVYAKELLS